MLEALKQWEQGTRSRQISRRSLKGFLEWAVLRGKLIAAYAPPAQIPETKNPIDIGYAIDDQEIIELLDLIPKEEQQKKKKLITLGNLQFNFAHSMDYARRIKTPNDKERH